MEWKNYENEENAYYAATCYCLAEQYSNLGEYEKARDIFLNVLGKNKI